MRTIRIFVDCPLQAGLEVILPEQAAAHAVRVLRLKAGDALTLFNGDGCDYPARLIAASPREVRTRIEAVNAAANESPLRIVLAQALARGEKMDWIVQKATELGVAAIIPLITERSEVRLDAARAGKRAAHWRAVAIAACEQSGRSVLPAIAEPASLETWAASPDRADRTLRLALLPDGGVRPRALGGVPESVVLVAGPEGGFGERDLSGLRGAGFRGLALGPRILRTETAGIVAIAALQALYGDL